MRGHADLHMSVRARRGGAVAEAGGGVKVVSRDGASSMTPSMVAFHESDVTQLVIGDGCVELQGKPEHDVLARAKRLMGRSCLDSGPVAAAGAQAMAEMARHCRSVHMDAADGVIITLRNGEVTTPVGLMALSINAKIAEMVAIGGLVLGVCGFVVTVPAYWTALQRDHLRTAMLIAGVENVHILRIVQEPTAAVFGMVLKDDAQRARLRHAADRTDTFMVFDLGGGTFDVSIVEMKSIEVNGSDHLASRVWDLGGDLWLGGGDMEDALAAALASIHGMDLESSSMAAVRLMHAMSAATAAAVAAE